MSTFAMIPKLTPRSARKSAAALNVAVYVFDVVNMHSGQGFVVARPFICMYTNVHVFDRAYVVKGHRG